MESKDLRIGNYVDWKVNKALKVEMLDGQCDVGGFDGVELCPISDWKPIPLTEEWAVKFGFESLLEMMVHFIEESMYSISLRMNGIRRLYVHEAQNLYHALTGEELTIINE